MIETAAQTTKEIPLQEIVWAMHLIQGEWGAGTWENMLPTIFSIYKDNPDLVKKIDKARFRNPDEP